MDLIKNKIKTAIILAGAPRTWHFCKEYIIKYVNDIFEDSDWYVSMYKSNTLEEDDFRKFMEDKGQNVVSQRFVRLTDCPDYKNRSDAEKHSNSYFKPLFYLMYLAGLDKRLYEYRNNVIYNRIVILRPDMLYLYNSETKKEQDFFVGQMKDFAFQLRGDYNETSYGFAGPSPSFDSLIAGTFAFDLYSLWNIDYDFKKARFSFRKGLDIHSGFEKFCCDHLLSLDNRWKHQSSLHYFNEVVRPTHICYNRQFLDFLTKNFDNFRHEDWPMHYEPGSCKFYKGEDQVKNILLSCQTLRIDPEDYGFLDKDYVEQQLEKFSRTNMSIKKVNKHWGYELWIADGVQTPYALKKILFKAGNRTSLQVHDYKFETNYVLSGKGKLYISKEKFDIDNFLKHGMTSAEVKEYESTFNVLDLDEGMVFHVPPGYVHRVVAEVDLVFMEASTCHLDDVIRIQDDQGRTHGRINYEHE